MHEARPTRQCRQAQAQVFARAPQQRLPSTFCRCRNSHEASYCRIAPVPVDCLAHAGRRARFRCARHGGAGPRVLAHAYARWQRGGIRQAPGQDRQWQGRHQPVDAQSAHPRSGAAQAAHTGRLERQQPGAVAGWQEGVLPQQQVRHPAAVRAAAGRRHPAATHRLCGGPGQLQALAGWQAHCLQCGRVPGLRLGPGLHQEEAGRSQERQGQRRGVRPVVRAPLGYLERWPSQHVVRRRAACGRCEGRGRCLGDQRHAGRRCTVQAVRRQ